MAARKIRLNRDFLVVAAPATVLVVGTLAVVLLLMRPAPPAELVMSTGTADGMYHAYAMKYRDILARDGVTLRLWPSGGALENLRRLARSRWRWPRRQCVAFPFRQRREFRRKLLASFSGAAMVSAR